MSRAESTTSVITEQGGLFVRNDQVVEELDLYVEYLLQPVHCIRICSELASVQLASAVYEQVAVQAYNDHLMTTSKELIGPLPAPTKKYDITAFSKPSGNGHERVGAPIDALPSMMVRFFDQCPDDMAATTLETNVLLAIREVVTRLYGWTLWEVDKVPWTRERHACLAEDILFNVLADQKKLGGGSSSTSAANGAVVAAAGGGIVFSKSHEVTRMHFTKRVDVIREVDITEQVLQQQEERAFRDKQAKLRQDQLRTQRYYSLLCSAGTPLDRRLASVQLWLDGIEKQEIKSIFIDSARRTVLHWIVDWSEEAYAKNRLGGDLLRSHIFFALELGISPLQLDGTNRTAMTIATSKKHPKPRALKILHDAARRSRATSRLPLETVLFESLAGRFLQVQFSATQAGKFFTLEAIPIRGVTEDSNNAAASSTDATSPSHCLAIFLYDLTLEWKFPVAQFDDVTVSRSALKTLDPSALRFYVVPFCRESHATTEGDILLCSNGAFVSVDYTAAHPRVKTFRSSRFGFDVVGGEGDGFCCTVQWQTSVVDTALSLQEHRERSQKEEAERAALRVARSSYLSSLAQELHELEGEVESRPKTKDELIRDSEDLFSNAFAERILLFPYGPQTDVAPDGASRSEPVSNATSFHRTNSRSGRSGSLSVGLSAGDFGVKFVREETMVSEEGGNAPISGPMGVVCVLSGGKLLAIPLSRYALTTHATAPLSDRVAKFMDAVDGGLMRMEKPASRTQSLVGATQGSGLFTPMAHRVGSRANMFPTGLLVGDPAADDDLDTSQTSNIGRGGAPKATPLSKRVSPINRAVSFVNSNPNADQQQASTPSELSTSMTGMTPHTFSITGNDQIPAGPRTTAESDSVLHPKVIAVDLSVFCRDAQAPITMTSTPDRILVGLPDGEVVQFTLASSQFAQVLEELPNKKRTSENRRDKEPLRGADYPCTLLGVDQKGSDINANANNNNANTVQGKSTTVLWCGKSFAARTVRAWGYDTDLAVRDILVEDRQQDQETTSAVIHPHKSHVILFSRRGYICVANLNTGFVGRLCPIVLSESEMTMRTQQMDLGIGDMSSGTEVLKFNAHGSILMRYSPLYHSAVLYDVRELDAMITAEERALVKASSLVCGFEDEDSIFEPTSTPPQQNALITATSQQDALVSRTDEDYQRALRAVASVPKERLRGYLERITSKSRQAPQARVDHAFFVVQAIQACPTFHANVGDGDGRNAPAILASLEQRDLEKDAIFQYWNNVLDDGGNLYQCSHNGTRAISEVCRSQMHVEAILEYERRQRAEIELRENRKAPLEDDPTADTTNDTSKSLTAAPAWQHSHVSLWEDTVFVQLLPGVNTSAPARLYSVNALGDIGVRYVSREGAPVEDTQLISLTPSTDKSFFVLPILQQADIVTDLVLLPSGILIHVEHPTVANGLHRPIVTIRKVSQLPELAEDDGSISAAVDDSVGFMSYCETITSAATPYQVEQVAASWVTRAELMNDDDARRMWNLDEELPPPDTYGQPQPRHAVVGHVAIFVRSAIISATTMDSSAPSGSSLRRNSSMAYAMQPDAALPKVADIPIVLTVEEWRRIMNPPSPQRSSLLGEEVLRIVLDGLDRGRTTVKSLDLDNPAPLVELGCSGPFAYLAVRERAQPTTSPRKGNNRRRSVTEQSSGHVRVYLADASCNFCVLPTFRRLSMVAPDGQRWAATSNVTAPSGNTFQCRPLYDDLSNTLHLAIAGVELAVVHVDWVGSEGNPHVCGRVMYFIEPSHLPSGESVSCAWIERSKVASLMHSDRGNMRLASKKLINSATAVQRSSDEEFALVFLREGHLCVMDVFVRKSATVVGTMPMLHRELDMMIRDEDIPDPTAGDPLLATRLPLKVLCGGLHRLCGVTSDGYLLRHNALHHATAVIDWTALCRIAAQHAEGPDEYGHIGGGISSRTLVCIPSSVLGNSSVGSSSPPVASPRGGMLINFNVPATNDPPQVRVATNSVLPEEFAATYVPPLRYDHKEPYNLVADARAPPRSTRLKGFLSRRNVPNDDPQTLAQLLHLFMDAMESNCTNPSQRDIRGRTAMHILADLFPHLSPADKQKWLDRLIKNNCNVFACDMAGESALDRPDVRSFLFRAMTNFSPDFEEDDEDEEVEDALPYRRHYASGLPAFEPLTVVGSSGSSTTESVVQTLWSRVSPSVLYIISDDGCLYRILCTTGSKQLLQRVPCCVAAMSTSTDQPQSRFVAAKVSAMLPSEATFEQGFPLPQDHQPADIILFNTGSVVIVYDPEGDATTHYEATGGFVWASSVSRSAAKGDPIAPSRLRAHEKQPHAPYDDCIDDMSSGFAPLCPSEQHAGIELVWFVRTGEAMLHPATTPVCMAVSARWFHVLQVVKLFAPRGINKIFPRHLSAMTATAVAHNIPVVPSRPERSLLRSHLNANGKSTGIDIHFYETARVDDKDGAAADACVTEVELQRFTQIVHAQHSPFGSVFFVTLQQGFISQECGVGELDVHIFSCPSFTPLGVVPIRSDFASSLAHQCEQFLNTSRGAFSLDIAKQQLWLALERQAASACLTVTDRTLSWCEGGGGMTVAKWDKQPGAAHKACAVVVTKGDHMFLRTPDHQGEMISVDRNIPGYHRRSGTHIAVSYGQLYSFDTSTGEAMCYGRLPTTGLTGDFSVSASTYHAASNTTTTNTASRGPILSAASFVAIHNQTTKSLMIISFERMQRVGRCFLHYTPMSIPLSNNGAGYDDDEAAIVPSSSASDSEQIAMNARSLVDELMRLEDTSELFTDPATLEARQSLKEVLEEQHDADMRRFDEQQMLAGMEASQRLTATSTPEDNDTIGTTSGLLQSKECHGHYWSRIQLLLPVTNESTTTAATVAREYPRICETEEELRTVERLYVTMLWPVLRGVLPLTGAVDGNGRTILMYHVMFYASYFKWVDAAAPRNKTLSRKYLRNVATRWERMKEEWRQLLTLGASVHLTDHYGCSLERHYLPLHSKVGTVLKSISSSLSAVPLGPVTASSEVSRRPPTSALAQWRQEQRSAPVACRGTSILCTLHSGDHANAGFDLALHTSQCCVSSGSAAFIAPVGLIDDHLWEDEPSASSSSALASQVAVIQLPWARNSVILMTPNSVMAIQHAGGSVATSSTAIRGLRSDLSRVDDSVASLEEAKESATSRSGGTKALFRKFTVPLRWSKADPKRRVKFSHWMSLDINGNTIFQFCGWSGAPHHTHHLTPFLRMWSCPQSFLHAESMSSLAQYVAKQLDDVTEAHVITQMNYVGCHSPTSLSQVGCVAFGNTVLFVSNGYVYAAQGTEALKNKSLLVPLESLDSACALVTLDNTMDIGRIAGAIEGSRDGNVKEIVDGRVIVRLAPDGCCCIPTPSGLLYCRVRQAHQHNGTSSQPIVVPSALIPTVCTLGDDISAPFMLADWRTTPSVMPSVADAPPSPALLLFAQQQTTDDVTPPFVAVAVNVRNDATCGSAVQWMSRLDQAMENVPLRQVLDAVLEDTDLEKSWRLDNRVEAAPHQQAHDDVAKTSRCGCFGAFSIPSA